MIRLRTLEIGETHRPSDADSSFWFVCGYLIIQICFSNRLFKGGWDGWSEPLVSSPDLYFLGPRVNVPSNVKTILSDEILFCLVAMKFYRSARFCLVIIFF